MSEGQAGIPPQLVVYRDTIDNLDAALVHLLAERFRCTQQVGLLKARLDLPPADPGREQQQAARRRPRGRARQAVVVAGVRRRLRAVPAVLRPCCSPFSVLRRRGGGAGYEWRARVESLDLG